jgi:2,3-bisphosphoglycerate-independent phosphoglycerate mutase
VLITADHGNCEQMFDPESNQAHTQHTTDKVPLVYVGNDKVSIREGGALKDIAPTLLAMMGLKKPSEMSGESLLSL